MNGSDKQNRPDDEDLEARDAAAAAGEGEDFVFRFRVDPQGGGKGVYEDPLTELVRSQLEALLRLVVLTRGGEEIRGVTGFKFMKQLERNYPIYPEE